MGWEWRVFFEEDPNLVSTFKIPVSDTRTDVYFVANNAVGLKLRGEGSQGLEMKVRKERNTVGTEKWEKHHVRCYLPGF